MKKRKNIKIVIGVLSCLVLSVCFWKFAGNEKSGSESETIAQDNKDGFELPEESELPGESEIIQTEKLETRPVETEKQTFLPETESGFETEQDRAALERNFLIEMEEEPELIQGTFLKAELDFRSLVSYRAELFNNSGLQKLLFKEKLSENEEELSFRIQLFFLDEGIVELAASYHKALSYSYLEEIEEFEKRKQEEEALKAYLSGFKPSVTEEKNGLKAYLGDLDMFVRETGTYLYNYFGKVQISEIHLEYLLREDPANVEIRLSLIEENGDQTPFCCTYFSKIEQYHFKMVEVYD